MGKKCCVPGCRSGYPDGDKVAIFKGPTDRDLQIKWEWPIKRKDSKVSESSHVCEKHFFPDTKSKQKENLPNKNESEENELHSKTPRLKAGAIPNFVSGMYKWIPPKSFMILYNSSVIIIL